MRSVVPWMAAVGLAAIGAGCASGPAKEEAWGVVRSGVEHDAADAGWIAALRADAVPASVPGEMMYAATDRGPAVLHASRERSVDGGGWVERWSLAPADGGPARPVRDEEFRVGDEGRVLVGNLDYHENVETVFEPALLVLPREMRVGEVREQRVAMTVHPLDDRTKVRATGSVVNTITYVGDDELRTPAGIMIARHLRAVFTADPGKVKVRVDMDQWFADGVGMVAERRTERTTLLFLPIRSVDESWVAAGAARPER